jgi:hypothetical protein
LENGNQSYLTKVDITERCEIEIKPNELGLKILFARHMSNFLIYLFIF